VSHSLSDHLRAIAVLAVGALMFAMATPALDSLDRKQLRSEEDREEMRQHQGTWAEVKIALADFNRAVRLPVTRRVERFQRPLRIRQAWSLYTKGPSSVYRLEIRVDGELRYRSNDPEYDWLRPQLTFRRVRPIVKEAVVTVEKARNWRGLTRFVVDRARAENPQVRIVELTATKASFPGPIPEGETTHTYYAEAPSWKPLWVR